MSEVAHKIEEPVVAPVDASTSKVEPKVETPAVIEPAVEVPVTDSTPEVTEPAVEATPEEVKPVEEGILAYKGPGLIKGLFPSKKFFWFGAEPVEAKSLSSYLRGEKAQDIASKNVAWAAHTGKGLLFFSKKATDKASPAGLFNLSEVSDINEEGTSSFTFTSAGHKHTFETASVAERDNWVAVLKSKAIEATELAPTVTETEEYKKFLNPTPVLAAAATEAPKPVENEVSKAEDKLEEKKEEKKTRKSRSASRKRNSIFGGFGLGKKEEKTELSKEETPLVSSVDEPTVSEPTVSEPVAAAHIAEPTSEVTEAAPVIEEASPVVERPVPSKRNSIFGTLQSRFSSKTEKKTEESPIIAKEELVSDNAPMIPAVGATEPITSVETSNAPVEATEAPAIVAETKPETPVVKSDKRKSSLPFGFGKKDKTTSDEESSEKPLFAKLRSTMKNNKREKISEKPAAIETSVEETPAVFEPAVISEPTPVVPNTTHQVAATSA